MREKLRGFFCPGKTAQENKIPQREEFEGKVKKFKDESQSFLEGGQNTLPMPLDYYVTVFENSYDFIA